jgi:hypothetical protein
VMEMGASSAPVKSTAKFWPNSLKKSQKEVDHFVVFLQSCSLLCLSSDFTLISRNVVCLFSTQKFNLVLRPNLKHMYLAEKYC